MPHSTTQVFQRGGLPGRFAPDPDYFRDCPVNKRIVALQAKAIQRLNHLTVVSRGGRGKGYPTHQRATGAVSPTLTAEPQCRSGDVESVTDQRLSVHGCDPTALRSEGLCKALERFHCSLYPPTPQPSLRTRRGPSKDEFEV